MVSVAPRLRATGLPYIASPEIKSSGNAQHIGTDTTASLIIIQVQRFGDTNCYEAWRHISCDNTINIIYVIARGLDTIDEELYGSGITG